MITKNNTEIGIKPELDISSAIGDFTNALVETVQYKNYESASTRFKDDQEAQKAYQEYQAKAKDLQTKQMFNSITEAEQEDLNRLQQVFLGYKTVQDYFDAQEEFQSLCRASAQVISDNCGLDYATACGACCCG